MRHNSEDKTLERNYLDKWQYLISEYKIIKEKRHTRYRFVGEFYKAHNISRQLFNKIYNRYSKSGLSSDLLPQKRGPKWRSRRPDIVLEKEVLEARKSGLNKYEICDMLKRKHGRKVLSPSGIYNISKRNGMGRLREAEKEVKRKIIKERPGELGHIDCHYIRKDLIGSNNKKQYYLVCVVDSFSRIAWAEVLEDIKSISVMFATMRIFNVIKQDYNIQFERILSDNGAEFASKNNTEHHPFERMLKELGVSHGYTRAYRPQTNGKVERFWRTLKEDLLESGFDSIDQLRDDLFEYLVYYNEMRSHQALDGKSPLEYLQNLSTN